MKSLWSSLVLAAVLAFTFTPVFLFLPPAIVLAGCTSGCAGGKGTFDPSTKTYNPTADADTVVVTAQKTRAIALGVFDLFLAAERQNEADLAKISPTIHASAEEIRANGKIWINDLTRLIAAYQTNRTTSNQINLRQAIATIQSAVASAQDALAKTRLDKK